MTYRARQCIHVAIQWGQAGGRAGLDMAIMTGHNHYPSGFSSPPASSAGDGWSGPPTRTGMQRDMTHLTLQEVLAKHRKAIMATPRVVGVGAGVSRRDPAEHCVLVYVDGGERPAGLPEKLEGYPVEVTFVKGGFRPS